MDGDCLVIEADTEEALLVAEREIFCRIATISITSHSNRNSSKNNKSSPLKQAPLRALNKAALKAIKRQVMATALHDEVRRHVFVDNSNVFIGAQTRGNILFYE